MIQIRPVTDLRDNFTDKLILENKIFEKLAASTIQAKNTDTRYDFDVVEKEMRAKFLEQ